ncbi:MAG: BrnA antitoxin family protein [Bacteroidetes bacterium]|nr:BrnA antitoxin family protein [Bacteroidota bacterium]
MKNQKLVEIVDYDNKETGMFINKNKSLKLKDLGVELPDEAPTKVISLRLPTELLNKVKAFASQNDISYTSMIKILLAQGIDKFSTFR